MTQAESPFYYLSHPHFAYRHGYCPLVGRATHDHIEYEAFTYHLPAEVTRVMLAVNDYFCYLIDHTSIPQPQRRLTSVFQVADLSLSLLRRISLAVESTDSITLRSADSEIPYMYIGPVHYAKTARRQFPDMDTLIRSYIDRHASPCECRPVTLYHRAKFRPVLDRIDQQASRNEIMAAGVCFLADVLQHASPLSTEVFDLFTNNFRHSPEDINHDLWRAARKRAFTLISSFGLGESGSAATTEKDWDRGRSITGFSYTPKPVKHTHVEITQVAGGLREGAKQILRFDEIEPYNEDEEIYRYYYC